MRIARIGAAATCGWLLVGCQFIPWLEKGSWSVRDLKADFTSVLAGDALGTQPEQKQYTLYPGMKFLEISGTFRSETTDRPSLVIGSVLLEEVSSSRPRGSPEVRWDLWGIGPEFGGHCAYLLYRELATGAVQVSFKGGQGCVGMTLRSPTVAPVRYDLCADRNGGPWKLNLGQNPTRLCLAFAVAEPIPKQFRLQVGDTVVKVPVPAAPGKR